MTDPITPATITRWRELLRVVNSFSSQSMRTAALSVLRKEAAKALPALLDQLAAQAAEIEGIKRDRDNIRYALEDYGKHINRAQSILSPRDLGKNYLHAALDQLEESEARVAELERELSLAAQRNAALLSEKDAVGAVLRTDSSLADLRGRVEELEGLLREIRDSYHDNRAGGCPGAGDMLEDAIFRIDAVLAGREGGR